MNAKASGTPATDTMPGDCKKTVCDGNGDTMTVADASDPPTTTNQCMNATCVVDQPTLMPKADGSTCSQNGGIVCKTGSCVACLSASNCPSGICTAQNTCAPSSCSDSVKNGSETDVDCGGGVCAKCVNGKGCLVPTDCISSVCTGGVCKPSCTDGIKNQDETDIDCGGLICTKCAQGKMCIVGGDCQTGNCNGGTCGPYKILISEVQTRGPSGGSDEFVELYNPLSVPVVLDSTFTIKARSNTASTYGTRWVGAGQTMPSHGHFLVAGTAYSGTVAPDATLISGISDISSVVVFNGATVIDALCFYCGATNPFDATYTCEGTPFYKTGCTTTTNYASAERKPGGAAGNGTDTNNNSADFIVTDPSNPEDLASAPTP